MKKAKLLLTTVIILTFIAGAIAFKANRQTGVFFSYGTTSINGAPITGCVVPVLLQRTTSAGGQITSYLTTIVFIQSSQVCTTKVIFSL